MAICVARVTKLTERSSLGLAVLVALLLAACSDPNDLGPNANERLEGSDAEASEDVDDAEFDAGNSSDSDSHDAADDGYDADADSEAYPPDGADDSADTDLDSDINAIADSNPDGPIGPIGPNVCGDGWRDSVSEECDDGLGLLGVAGDRACTADCVVADRLSGVQTIDVRERWLGIGRHAVAGGVHGHAVVMSELAGVAGNEARVALYAFSPVGERLGGTSWEVTAIDADPVVAALPNGDYAVVYTAFDADGDGLGIALARVSNEGNVVDHLGFANMTTVFSQRLADAVWTGTQLVVGWEDESTIPRRICARQFTADLLPGGGEVCTWESDAVSRVSLESLQGRLITSYRADEDEWSTYRVRLPSGGVFSTDQVVSPSFDETIALAELDEFTLLAVYVDGDQVMRASLFDDVGVALDEATVLGNPRSRPSLAVTADGIYLAWWEPSEVPMGVVGWDPIFEELWLQRLSWDGAVLDATADPIPLPREDMHRLGDQLMPSLAAVPYWPSGGLVAAWTDRTGTNYGGQAPHGDVVVELIPTPVVRKGGI